MSENILHQNEDALRDDLERRAKETELSFIEKDNSGLDKKVLLKRSDIYTSSEHRIFGSTSYGLAYFPNHTYADLIGVEIQKINQARAEVNKETLQLPLAIKHDNDYIYPLIKLLPLDQNTVSDINPRRTYEVMGTINLSGENIILDQDSIEHIYKKIDELIADGQKSERELYLKKLRN